MDKKRPAIALLMTLSIIVAMLSLMGVMFGYLNSARDRAELKSSLIQADLLMTDLPGQVRQLVGNKPSQSSMFRLSRTPLLAIATNGEFSSDTRCSPLSNRANLAWLAGKSTNTRTQAKITAQRNLVNGILTHIYDTTNLKDSARLHEIISTIATKKIVKVFGSKGRLNKKTGIISYGMFNDFLDEYYLETGDARVYSIPWRNYFVFGVKTEEIDGDFMPAELMAYMYDMEVPEAKEHINANPKKGFKLSSLFGDYPEFSNRYPNIISKTTVSMARCTSSFKFRNENHSFKFNYIRGKAEGFEFFSR